MMCVEYEIDRMMQTKVWLWMEQVQQKVGEKKVAPKNWCMQKTNKNYQKYIIEGRAAKLLQRLITSALITTRIYMNKWTQRKVSENIYQQAKIHIKEAKDKICALRTKMDNNCG